MMGNLDATFDQISWVSVGYIIADVIRRAHAVGGIPANWPPAY